MGKALSIGVNNVARKGKSVFIGVDNVARKVKKAWIGDANGVAREFFSSAEPFYWIQDSVVQDGFPSAYKVNSLTPSSSSNTNSLTKFSLTGSASGNSTFDGVTDEITTGGNKFMEITFSLADPTNKGKFNKLVIGGVDYASEVANNAVITADVSKLSTVSISLNVTAWAYNTIYAYIKSIRFYS